MAPWMVANHLHRPSDHPLYRVSVLSMAFLIHYYYFYFVSMAQTFCYYDYYIGSYFDHLWMIKMQLLLDALTDPYCYYYIDLHFVQIATAMIADYESVAVSFSVVVQGNT